MGSASRYWRLLRLDGMGKQRVEEVALAKAFFQQQFAQAEQMSDALIQQQLWQWLQSLDESKRQPAEVCLRCWISHQIEQTCGKLAAKFGDRHGFTRTDLFPFVLNDVLDHRTGVARRSVPTQYQSLASEILQTFDPDRAGLSTWVMRQVRHHPDLRAFLHEHGVYLATDWSILNDTSPNYLQQILAEFYAATPLEIALAYDLLQGYHAVYRSDRLQKRQQGRVKDREVCSPPTLEQLTRIEQFLQAISSSAAAAPEAILNQLQKLAAQLRQYRLHRLGGILPTESIDQSQTQSAVESQMTEADADWEDEQEFLTFYRQQIVSNLDEVLKQVTSDRTAYLQRKNAPMAQQFLIALHLFHCRGQSMSEIAPQIGLRAQFQVSRLLKLKEFRTTVRSQLLQRLRDCISDKAKTYADPARLQQLNQQIELILEEQVSILLNSAEKEAAVAKPLPLASLFARRLCRYLDTLNLNTQPEHSS